MRSGYTGPFGRGPHGREDSQLRPTDTNKKEETFKGARSLAEIRLGVLLGELSNTEELLPE